MKTKPICERFSRQFLFVFLGFVIFLIVTLLLLLFGIPLALLRILVKFLSKIFRPDLVEMVQPASAMFTVDKMTTEPRNNILTWMGVEGRMEIENIRGAVMDQMVNLKVAGNQLAYPELKQYFHPWFGYYFWSREKDFSIESHVKVLNPRDLGLCINSQYFTKSDLLEIVPGLAASPWSQGKSPWEFLLLYNYVDDQNDVNPKTLVMFKFHHAIGDGYSVLKMILSCLTDSKEAKIAKPNYVKRKRCHSFWHLLLLPLKMPYEFAQQLIDARDYNDWILPFEKLSPLPYSVEVDGIPMDQIKEIKNIHKVGFMAVLVGAISGAIRRTMVDNKQKVPVQMKACNPVPIPGHPNNKLVNHLSYIGIKFPIEVEGGRERLLISQRDLNSLKYSTLPMTNFWLSRFIGSCPACIIGFVRQSLVTTTLITSNFPGPLHEIKLLGHRMVYLAGTNGLYYGTPAVTLLMLSYAGKMRINVNINKSLIKSRLNTKELAQRIREEFNLLLKGHDEIV